MECWSIGLPSGLEALRAESGLVESYGSERVMEKINLQISTSPNQQIQI
jgi:hypothetical protein